MFRSEHTRTNTNINFNHPDQNKFKTKCEYQYDDHMMILRIRTDDEETNEMK